jgi:hypothetical protein
MGQMQTLSRNNTRISTDNGTTSITLHSTVVVQFSRDRIRLHSGGWQTVTTKARMNQASNQFGLGYTVFQKDFEWFVTLPSGYTIPFEDGMTFQRVYS